MESAPDKMECHIQLLEQYLGDGTLHRPYQRVSPDDNEFLYITSQQKDIIPPLVYQVASRASKAP